MTTHNRPDEQRPLYTYSSVQQDTKTEASAHPTEITTARKSDDYKPFELSTSVLVAFCVVVFFIFVLVQMGAAAFMGSNVLRPLVSRSIETHSPLPSPSSAPSPSFWTGSYAPEPTGGTTAPLRGSFSSTDFDIGNVTIHNTITSSSASGWKDGYYFLGAYLPTLVSVLLGIWWKCIFARLKEMEPFYQMGKSGGAGAKDSVLLAYPGASLVSVLVRSAARRHWLSLMGSINMALMTLCTLLASETLLLTSAGPTCGVRADSDASSNKGCRILLTMRPVLGWVLSGVLVVVFVLTIAIAARLRRLTSGIRQDRTTIAGVACLYSNELATEFSRSIHDESAKYVLTPAGIMPVNSMATAQANAILPPYQLAQQTPPSGYKKYGHASLHPAALTAFLLFSTGMLFMILYYRFISKPFTGNALEDFMNSQSFGIRLFMTALGLVVKFYWGWIESYMRSTRPYAALAMPTGASAAKSVLVYSPSHPLTALFCKSTWGSLLLASVTVMALLSEVLIVTLSGVPFTTATIYLAFEVSVYVSTGILAAMVVTIAAVLVWTRRSRVRSRLPKVPESIADVFGLLGDAKGREALRGLHGGEEGSKASSSQVRLRLRERVNDGVLCISKVDDSNGGVA
jgi:hypothetical protein